MNTDPQFPANIEWLNYDSIYPMIGPLKEIPTAPDPTIAAGCGETNLSTLFKYSTFKFLGCHIKSFNVSGGWGTQAGKLTVNLIEDPVYGDQFVFPEFGALVCLSLSTGFSYCGLIEDYNKTTGINGPEITVTINDGRVLLENYQLILGDYYGAIGGTKNIANVIGYLNQYYGYNAALSSESGILWTAIITALMGIMNDIDPRFGKRPCINAFSGTSIQYYGVLLSNFYDFLNTIALTMPEFLFYKIQGKTKNLLDVIAEIADVSGHEFFIGMNSYGYININFIPKWVQPSGNFIEQMTTILAVGNNHITSTVSGFEFKNDVTDVLIFGGKTTTTWTTNTFIEMLGYDPLANTPIISIGKYPLVSWTIAGSPINYNPSSSDNITEAAPETAPPQPFEKDDFNQFGVPNEGGEANRTQSSDAQRVINGDKLSIDNIPNPPNVSGTDPDATNYAVTNVTFDAVYSSLYNLFVPELNDILGSNYYQCTRLEMLFALHDMQSWMYFLFCYRPLLCSYLGGFSSGPGPKPNDFGQTAVGNPAQWQAGADPLNVKGAVQSAEASINPQTVKTAIEKIKQRIYSSVTKYAQELGKKWLVALPSNVFTYLNTEDLSLQYSYEVADEGGYPNLIPAAIQVPEINKIMTEDGKFYTFGRFSAAQADISSVNPSQSFVGLDNYLYIRGQASKTIYKLGGISWAQVDLDTVWLPPNGIFNIPANQSLFSQLLQGNIGGWQSAFMSAMAGGSVSQSLGCHVNNIAPNSITIPLKSNMFTYGPWWFTSNYSATAKAQVEQNDSLVPWNFGLPPLGYTNMNKAGLMLAQSAAIGSVWGSTGSIKVVGLPSYNIGNIMVTNGPWVQDINVSYGTDAPSTTYNFRINAKRIGQALTKDYVNRFTKLNQGFLKTAAYNRTLMANSMAAARAGRGDKLALSKLDRNLPQARQSTFPVLFSQVVDRENGYLGVMTSIADPQEAIQGGHSYIDSNDDSVWTSLNSQSAITSLSHFFVPYILDWYNEDGSEKNDLNYDAIAGNGFLGWYIQPPSSVWLNNNIISAKTYHPFFGRINQVDITPSSIADDWCTWSYDFDGNKGWDYQDARLGRNLPLEELGGWSQFDMFVSNVKRVIGFKGPMVLTSHGFQIDGKYWGPSQDLRKMPTGPIDLLWDNNRQVWTSHDILIAKANNSINMGNSGTFSLLAYTTGVLIDTNFDLYGVASMGGVGSGENVTLGYHANDNKWHVIRGGGASDYLAKAILGTGLVSYGVVYDQTIDYANNIDMKTGVAIYNYFGSLIPEGTNVIVGRINNPDLSHSWYVIAADCSS